MTCNYKVDKSMKCQFCKTNDETTEHLFQCSKIEYLRQDLKMKEKNWEDEDSATAKNVANFITRIEKIMISNIICQIYWVEFLLISNKSKHIQFKQTTKLFKLIATL